MLSSYLILSYLFFRFSPQWQNRCNEETLRPENFFDLRAWQIHCAAGITFAIIAAEQKGRENRTNIDVLIKKKKKRCQDEEVPEQLSSQAWSGWYYAQLLRDAELFLLLLLVYTLNIFISPPFSQMTIHVYSGPQSLAGWVHIMWTDSNNCKTYELRLK